MGLSDDDLSWIAGILDLKGVVVYKKNKQRATPQIVLYVETRKFGVVRALAALTGTMPEIQEKKQLKDWMRRGCAEHCPERHVHVSDRDGYQWSMPAIARWTVSGAAAAVVIFNVQDRLRVNDDLRHVMADVLEQSTISGQGWGATRMALRRLRNFGWSMPPKYRDLDLGTDD